MVTVAGSLSWVSEVQPAKARDGIVTRSFGRRKCGRLTRASIPPMHQAARAPIPPGSRQRFTAASDAARACSSSCAADRHAWQAAAKQARQCVSSFSATIASSSAGSDSNTHCSSATAMPGVPEPAAVASSEISGIDASSGWVMERGDLRIGPCSALATPPSDAEGCAIGRMDKTFCEAVSSQSRALDGSLDADTARGDVSKGLL